MLYCTSVASKTQVHVREAASLGPSPSRLVPSHRLVLLLQ